MTIWILSVYETLKTGLIILLGGVLGVAGFLSEGIAAPEFPLMPLCSLLDQQLSDSHQKQTVFWTADCVGVARGKVLDRAGELTVADLLPFPGSAVGDKLDTIPSSDGTNCGTVGRQLLSRVAADLSELRTSSGTSLTAVWRAELGLEVEEIARFLVAREVNLRLHLLKE